MVLKIQLILKAVFFLFLQKSKKLENATFKHTIATLLKCQCKKIPTTPITGPKGDHTESGRALAL